MMRSFTWNQSPIKICDWFLAYFTCGVKLLEYRYAQVWIIAKRWKLSPIGWFLENLLELLIAMNIVKHEQVMFSFLAFQSSISLKMLSTEA